MASLLLVSCVGSFAEIRVCLFIVGGGWQFSKSLEGFLIILIFRDFGTIG